MFSGGCRENHPSWKRWWCGTSDEEPWEYGTTYTRAGDIKNGLMGKDLQTTEEGKRD